MEKSPFFRLTVDMAPEIGRKAGKMRAFKSVIILGLSMFFMVILVSQAWAGPPEMPKESGRTVTGAQILKPARGDTWFKGQYYLIRWRGIDLAPGDFAHIYLCKDEPGGGESFIKSFPMNTNEICFRVDNHIASSTHYLIRIKLFKAGNFDYPTRLGGTIESEPYFTIKACPLPIKSARAQELQGDE